MSREGICRVSEARDLPKAAELLPDPFRFYTRMCRSCGPVPEAKARKIGLLTLLNPGLQAEAFALSLIRPRRRCSLATRPS